MVDRFLHGSRSEVHPQQTAKLINNRPHEALVENPVQHVMRKKSQDNLEFHYLIYLVRQEQKRKKKISNKRQHMVVSTVMEWLRTPLTIFRQAAWVETCCYAPKV